MTDARLVWDTWRRILTSDELVEAVLRPGPPQLSGPGLSDEQIAILEDYASTPAATDTMIGMYRRGLVRNALAALNFVPLSRRLLYTSELDVEDVAAGYVRSNCYRDDGPNFWRIAGGFVAHLAALPAFSSQVFQDVLSLDAAAVALMRRLGESAPAWWPESVPLNPAAVRGSDRYIANTAAVAVSSNYDLTPWLEDPLNFAVDEEPEPAPRHWMIYVPGAEASYNYAELSGRAARAFSLLSMPKTAAELSPDLDGLPVGEVFEVIESLAAIGVVAIAEER